MYGNATVDILYFSNKAILKNQLNSLIYIAFYNISQ